MIFTKFGVEAFNNIFRILIKVFSNPFSYVNNRNVFFFIEFKINSGGSLKE
ncbi:MAG TPA: hypothetical protein PKY82_03460 [Pyrinomonadaceae bacterium]|nr:hypothetical protein [Pyrinomonadaceae bacterium]